MHSQHISETADGGVQKCYRSFARTVSSGYAMALHRGGEGKGFIVFGI
jgi:hypothetical protein